MKRFTALLLFLLCSQTLWAEKPNKPKKPSLVTSAEVISRPLQQVLPLSGTTEAVKNSGLSPRIEGLVAQLLVDEGDWVKAGQTLLQLDDAIARTQLNAAQSRVKEAEVRYQEAQRQRKEFQTLRKRQHIAANDVESARADENAAKAALTTQRAELQRLEELLARHTLKSPFAGLVAAKQTETGQWVKADSAVLTLVELDTIRVRASLPQNYYQRLAKEAEARVTFDALAGKTFTGKLSGLISVGDRNTRSFPLFIDIDNPQHVIAPGMSAQVFVELRGNDAEAMLVPRDAVVLRADGSRLVWRIKEDKEQAFKVEPVKLLMGRAQGSLVEALESKLQVGDRIVLLGNESLRPGQAVQVSQNQGR